MAMYEYLFNAHLVYIFTDLITFKLHLDFKQSEYECIYRSIIDVYVLRNSKQTMSFRYTREDVYMVLLLLMLL